MPSEPRAPVEPTLEELSAYVDHELDAAALARVEAHLLTCADCRTRVDGLRHTAHAVGALPMESPPRAFTIPAVRDPQAQKTRNWVPVGWIGGVAAAFLIIIYGALQLHGTGTTPSTTSFGAAAPAVKQAAPGAGAAQTNRAVTQADRVAYAYATTVGDPRQPSRSLTLSADAATYAASGTVTIRVHVSGLAAGQVSAPSLLLERNGYAVALPAPAGDSSVPGSFQASYAIASLALNNPVDGGYTLIAIEPLPGGGASLIARLPITIGG